MGEAQSTQIAGDASKDPEIVSKKVKDLKSQGETMAKALLTKVEEVSVECQNVLKASNNDRQVAAVVALRLDSFSDLLQNGMLKFQGAEASLTQTKSGEKLLSSLLERIEKVEESKAALEKMFVDNILEAHTKASSTKKQGLEIQQLQSDFGTLKKSTSELKVSMSEVQRKTSVIPGLEHKLETVTTDLKACQRESDRLKEKVKNLQALVIDSASLRTQVKKMKSKHNTLKQQMLTLKDEKDTASLLFAKKVSNLEKLRNILNGYKPGAEAGAAAKPQLREMRKASQLDLQAVSLDVQNLSTIVGQLMRPPVGFTAQLSKNIFVGQNAEIRKLSDIITSTGNCFKPNQGHFVAPFDGLYCFCVKPEQIENQTFTASLMTKKGQEEADKKYRIPMFNDSPHSALCVLQLCANDRVFVKITESNGRVQLCHTFTFSGWSIRYY